MVWDDTFHDYIKGQWDKYDIVILTRIDDDDFVNKDAVQDTRDILGTGDFEIILCGYHYGYRYFSDTHEV